MLTSSEINTPKLLIRKAFFFYLTMQPMLSQCKLLVNIRLNFRSENQVFHGREREMSMNLHVVFIKISQHFKYFRSINTMFLARNLQNKAICLYFQSGKAGRHYCDHNFSAKFHPQLWCYFSITSGPVKLGLVLCCLSRCYIFNRNR